jgi:hypothetical protein
MAARKLNCVRYITRLRGKLDRKRQEPNEPLAKQLQFAERRSEKRGVLCLLFDLVHPYLFYSTGTYLSRENTLNFEQFLFFFVRSLPTTSIAQIIKSGFPLRDGAVNTFLIGFP